MDIDQAVKLVKEIRPRIAVPMHYNTFGEIEADPELFCKQLEGVCECAVLKPGEVMKVAN